MISQHHEPEGTSEHFHSISAELLQILADVSHNWDGVYFDDGPDRFYYYSNSWGSTSVTEVCHAPVSGFSSECSQHFNLHRKLFVHQRCGNMAITWRNYNAVLLWNINREKKTHVTIKLQRSLADDASQTGVLSDTHTHRQALLPECDLRRIICSVQLRPLN